MEEFNGCDYYYCIFKNYDVAFLLLDSMTVSLLVFLILLPSCLQEKHQCFPPCRSLLLRNLHVNIRCKNIRHPTECKTCRPGCSHTDGDMCLNCQKRWSSAGSCRRAGGKLLGQAFIHFNISAAHILTFETKHGYLCVHVKCTLTKWHGDTWPCRRTTCRHLKG